MEAHALLHKKGFKANSFGAGRQVRLPGEHPLKPNIYEFGTTYDSIYEDLSKKNHTRSAFGFSSLPLFTSAQLSLRCFP
jgi:hypothetical protein